MKTIPIQKTITIEEAAKLLGCSISNILFMGRRGYIIKLSTGIYDRSSVLSRAGLKKRRADKIHSEITKIVIQHFEDYTEPPTYRYIQSKTKTSSVSTTRYYVYRMKSLGLLEIHRKRIWLPGLRNKIKELVRTEYPK